MKPRWSWGGSSSSSSSSKLPVPSIASAFPVFLLGAALVLLLYQLRLGWHQAVRTGDDYEALQKFKSGLLLPDNSSSSSDAAAAAAAAAVLQDTLLLYIYNEDDPVYRDNFQHFLLAGVQPGSRCRYVVLVQERGLRSAVQLPEVLGVEYVYYGGTCFEWGMVGWLLQESGQVQWQQYKYFMFLSSAVRGPFMPTYLQGSMHWADGLLQLLNARVKLVGPTISCAGAPAEPGMVNSSWRLNPHIPFSAVATDRAGLDVLLSDFSVVGCHSSTWAAKYHSELGAAAAMFKAGYSIDSLMIRYQAVDWSRPSSWQCNRRWDPAGPGDFSYDGIALDPMEVMFVRVSSGLLAQRVPMAIKALKYSQWAADVAAAAAGLQHNLTARVLDNAYAAEKGRYKLPRILSSMMRGIKCFDVAFFLAHNRDTFKNAPMTSRTMQAVWKFFVYLGQFEDRPFRYTCGMNYTSVSTPAF
ncbi:hypothetical protein OEZ86_008629 [Tetradesmus obliquus]|nr:hypothetical protein OEZ86_008629 [Tetradesmus obliquus]